MYEYSIRLYAVGIRKDEQETYAISMSYRDSDAGEIAAGHPWPWSLRCATGKRVEPVADPFGPKVLPMSPE